MSARRRLKLEYVSARMVRGASFVRVVTADDRVVCRMDRVLGESMAAFRGRATALRDCLNRSPAILLTYEGEPA